jgi:hypothetical protein
MARNPLNTRSLAEARAGRRPHLHSTGDALLGARRGALP